METGYYSISLDFLVLFWGWFNMTGEFWTLSLIFSLTDTNLTVFCIHFCIQLLKIYHMILLLYHSFFRDCFDGVFFAHISFYHLVQYKLQPGFKQGHKQHFNDNYGALWAQKYFDIFVKMRILRCRLVYVILPQIFFNWNCSNFASDSKFLWFNGLKFEILNQHFERYLNINKFTNELCIVQMNCRAHLLFTCTLLYGRNSTDFEKTKIFFEQSKILLKQFQILFKKDVNSIWNAKILFQNRFASSSVFLIF